GRATRRTGCAGPTTKQSNIIAFSLMHSKNRLNDSVMTHFKQTACLGHRIGPVLSTLALALVLAGCATPEPSKDGPSQFVVHTSSGQGWRQEGPPSTKAQPVPE